MTQLAIRNRCRTKQCTHELRRAQLGVFRAAGTFDGNEIVNISQGRKAEQSPSKVGKESTDYAPSMDNRGGAERKRKMFSRNDCVISFVITTLCRRNKTA